MMYNPIRARRCQCGDKLIVVEDYPEVHLHCETCLFSETLFLDSTVVDDMLVDDW